MRSLSSFLLLGVLSLASFSCFAAPASYGTASFNSSITIINYSLNAVTLNITFMPSYKIENPTVLSLGGLKTFSIDSNDSYAAVQVQDTNTQKTYFEGNFNNNIVARLTIVQTDPNAASGSLPAPSGAK